MTDILQQISFEDMIRQRTTAWMNDYDESNRPRINEAVTMTMRKRGDSFGYCNNHKRGVSQWRVFNGKGLVAYPFISRTVRSKTATQVATKIQIQVEAVRSLPEKEAGAELAKNIFKYHEQHLLTKQMQSSIAELGQLARFSFVHSNYRDEGGMLVEVAESREIAQKFGTTVYTCHSCGLQFTPEDLGAEDPAEKFKDDDLEAAKQLEREQDNHFQIAGEGEDEASEFSQPKQLTPGAPAPATEEQTEESEDSTSADAFAFDSERAALEQNFPVSPEDEFILSHTAKLRCPECQTNTLVMDERAKYEPVEVMTGRYHQRDTGTMDTRVVSPLLIRLDTYKAIGFQYQFSDWFNYHPLIPAYEIYALAPHLQEKINLGARNAWSESARWHFELNNNSSSSVGYTYNGKSYQLDELIEVNFWWIAPQACFGWVSPDDYECPFYVLDDESGEPVQIGEFTINTGETIAQAFKRQSPDGKFNGLLVAMIGDEIAAVGNEHFLEKWVGFPWKVDAQSFFPQGEESLLKLADACTNMLSMAHAHAKRFSIPKLIVDTRRFKRQDIEKNEAGQIIYTDNTLVEAADQDWKKFIGYLQPEDISAIVLQMIQMMIDIAKEETGVFNETVGNSGASDETLGGRKLMLNQSLNLQTPVEQSKGVAMTNLAYCWLEMFQKHAPDEAYNLIKGTFEEEWKPQDIEAFRNLNIRKELYITVVEGTDLPKTQSEMEQRFMMAINLGLFQEPNPMPLQIRQHIVKSVLGIDYDVSNYDSFKRLASARYAALKKELEILDPNEAFTIMPDPLSGFPVRQLRPEIVASFAQDVRTAARQTDEHLVFIEYYIDQINGLVGGKEPNEVLVAALDKQIDAHRAYLAASMAQAAAAESAAMGGAGGSQSMEKPGEKKPAPAQN